MKSYGGFCANKIILAFAEIRSIVVAFPRSIQTYGRILKANLT